MHVSAVSWHFQPVLALLLCGTGISVAQWSSQGYQEGHPWINKRAVKIPTWTWGLWGMGFPDQYYFRNGSSNGPLAFR